MKFEELQQEWQAAKRNEPRSDEEWLKMMYAPAASRFKRVTWREFLIFLRTVFFFSLIIYLFDGLKTLPGWILTAYWAYVFFDEFVGMRYIRFTPLRNSLQQSLTDGLARMKRGALISKIAHAIFWLLVVISLGITHTGSLNILWWALILSPVLVAVTWWSGRKWSNKISEVKELLEVFNDDPEMPIGPAV